MTAPIPHQFPSHSNPRNWFITAGASPIGLALARAVLAHGDSVILGAESADVEKGYGRPRERAEELERFVREDVGRKGWGERCRVVGLDGRCEAPCCL